MKIQVLVAAMNQCDHSLLQRMNIRTDAIIGNQTDHDSIEHFEWNGHNISYYNFKEKGVGLNRNNALMRATADICLFADDDMVYVDDYQTIITETFDKYYKYDVIIFNIIEEVGKQRRYIIKKPEKVGYLNFMRYGAVRIACRLKPLKENAIYFNECFGGGTEYRHGEDTLFLANCLNKKLKIIAVPVSIAKLTEERPSTWNVGYDDKYFLDQGKLYRVLSNKWYRLLILQDCIRHRKLYKKSWIKSYRLMKKGAYE